MTEAYERRAIGHRLRILRERRGWGRDELARRLSVHAGSIARWETGGAVPHAFTLERIAELTGGTVEWIRTGREQGELPLAPEPDDAADADPFATPALVEGFLASIGLPGEERPRKLDALAGLRQMLTARQAVPGWWYDLRQRVGNGEI